LTFNFLNFSETNCEAKRRNYLYSLTAKIFERRESELLIYRLYKAKEIKNDFPGTRRSNTVELSTSSNGIMVIFLHICFRSLLSLKQVCCACLGCICEAMLDSMNLPDKTVAERFFLVLFQYTKSSKRDKNFPKDFFTTLPSCVFH